MRKIRKTSLIGNLLLEVLFIFLIVMLRKHLNTDYQWFYVLCSINFGYLTFKITTSFFYRPVELDEEAAEKMNYSITAIIPCYNESLESIEKAIQSLLNQTVIVDEILFIDDGSKELDCYEYLVNYPNPNIQITAHRFDENQGKKAAVLWGIQHAKSDLLLMLDSDGELTENTVEELRKPFSQEKVGTVCGRIMVRNYKTNFLTRIQELIYFNAFEVGRASQSLFNDVIVASGALSMHRRAIFDEESLKTFKKERFFGFKCVAGDDRLLTDISKSQGYHCVYQNTGICYTEVPSQLKKYFKQQVRWLKSAYLQALYSLRHTWRKPILLLYQFLETYLWFVNLLLAIFLLVTKGIHLTRLMLIVALIYTLLVSLLNSIKFRQYGYQLYVAAIAYSLIYGVLIVIMRIYALLTLWKTGWSTR